MPKDNSSERGQVLLIVVLVLVVGLIVGLSVATRTITNLRLSTEEENSQRAFSAAEAGIEQVLKNRTNIPNGTFTNSTRYNATISPVGGGKEFLLASGGFIEKDNGDDVWLVPHNADGSLNYTGAGSWQILSGNNNYLVFFWGLDTDVCDSDPSRNTQAALEIIAITGNPLNPVTTRHAIDPCDDRRSDNQFERVNNSPAANGIPVLGNTYQYKYPILISDSSRGIVVRAIPLYAQTKVAVKSCSNPNGAGECGGGANLPTQGATVESTGIDTSSRTARKISVFQGFPKLPNEFFQYVLLSP